MGCEQIPCEKSFKLANDEELNFFIKQNQKIEIFYLFKNRSLKFQFKSVKYLYIY